MCASVSIMYYHGLSQWICGLRPYSFGASLLARKHLYSDFSLDERTPKLL